MVGGVGRSNILGERINSNCFQLSSLQLREIMRTSSYCLILLSSIVTAIHALTAPKHHAVVVGGGPVGIAAALTLAKHHNYSVTLLESSPVDSAQTKYDPSK